MDSEAAISYLYGIVRAGDVHPLKYVLREVRDDYENPCDYLLKHCRTVTDLENCLKEYAHHFMVENGKVARSTDPLESGRLNADKYFAGILEERPNPVSIEELRKRLDDAPADVKDFMAAFYPHFKRYLQHRPNVFAVFKDTVGLIERESVKYFQQALKMIGEGTGFISLRGCVAQAPDQVMKYINAQYPGNEFKYFLENNGHAFVLNNKGCVYLAR